MFFWADARRRRTPRGDGGGPERRRRKGPGAFGPARAVGARRRHCYDTFKKKNKVTADRFAEVLLARDRGAPEIVGVFRGRTEVGPRALGHNYIGHNYMGHN